MTQTDADRDAVRWHDLECGPYDVDLPMWRALVREAGHGPVLDVGAGTGRVSLDLATRGVPVVALDLEASLLAALTRRATAARLTVEVVRADAREIALDARFAAIIVPMQTIQLLGGPEGRGRFLRAVLRHLRPGGLFAAALADAVEGYDAEQLHPPVPDMAEHDGVLYASRPLAVRVDGRGATIERLREIVSPAGVRVAVEDAVTLDHLDASTLEDELRAAGLEPLPRRAIAATDEYVGSAVVVGRG